MRIKKFMFCASVCMLVSAISVTGQAAEKQQDKLNDVNKDKTPIVIEADKLSFSDVTGDLFAEGHVVLKKNTESILSDYMRGNSKQTEVWIDGKATLQQPNTELIGTGAHYNYTSRVGSMQKVIGTVGKGYVTGGNMEIFPTKLVAHDGTITGCPAIVPDYHISAEKLEIWPGDKMIAYNAKFWIGNTVIFSLPKYQTSLIKNEGESAFPRIGYNSSNGFMIHQYLEYPFGDRLAMFGDLTYYSKRGFEPIYGFVSRQSNYTLKLYQGNEENSDNEWVKKEPELMLKMKPKRFGQVVGDVTITSGKWTEGAISGTRQDYKVYFSRDPIKLGSKVTLKVGTGWEKIDYGYDNSTNNIWSFNTIVTAKPNDRLETWVGYHNNNQSGKSVYEYDDIDIPRKVSGGFMYKIDKMNAVGVKMDYDVDLNKVKDVDYTWKRNLHCFEGDITYRAKRDEWRFKVDTLKW